MTISLPLAVGGRLVGSTVFVHRTEKELFFSTCLHLLGESAEVQVVTPPHGGNCAAPQDYPFETAPAIPARVVASDPFADLAILAADAGEAQSPPPPRISPVPWAAAVGAEVVVLGYPFAPLGSVLETWTPAFVTAHAKRRIAPAIFSNELVLSNLSHPGSSGSAVVGRRDGVLHGIVRGSLAPPEALRIGDIPIATDTSVTFATCSDALSVLLAWAVEMIGAV